MLSVPGLSAATGASDSDRRFGRSTDLSIVTSLPSLISRSKCLWFLDFCYIFLIKFCDFACCFSVPLLVLVSLLMSRFA